MAFETKPVEVARWVRSRKGHPALNEAGGVPETPDLVFDGDGREGSVHEVDWPEFMDVMKKSHLGLLHGGGLCAYLFIREDDLPLPGLPDVQA